MSDDLPNSRLHAKQIEFTTSTALAGGKHAGKFLQTVKSIRELAENFDKRSGALTSDGRRTFGDVSRAVNIWIRARPVSCVHRKPYAAFFQVKFPVTGQKFPVPRNISLLIVLGNFVKSDCSTAVSCYEIGLSEPQNRNIPCKIPCYQGICVETGAISTA